MLSARLIFSSLLVYDCQIWCQTLLHFERLFEQHFKRVNLSKDFKFYIIANLALATELHPAESLERCFILILGLCEKLIHSNCAAMKIVALPNTSKDLKSFMNIPEWMELYEKHLLPSFRKINGLRISDGALLKARYTAIAQNRNEIVSKELKAIQHTTDIVTERIEGESLSVIDSRKSRVSETLIHYDKNSKEVGIKWQIKSQELMMCRQVWEDENPSRFQIGEFQNQVGMKRRLVQNLRLSDHSEASARRDQNLKATLVEGVRSQVESFPNRSGAFLARLKLYLRDNATSDNETDEAFWTQKESDLKPIYDSRTEVCLISLDCQLCTCMTEIFGVFQVTSKHLRFSPDTNHASNAANPGPLSSCPEASHSQKWPLDDLTKIFFRKHQLDSTALEFFMTTGNSLLFNFPGLSKPPGLERNRVLKHIYSISLINLTRVSVGSPAKAMEGSNFTQMWVDRKISTFEYLMQLNHMSGRSYNDLSRYPVFPWVISDYQSATLNLNDHRVFRDLSKPVGALDSNRLEYFKQRSLALEDPGGGEKFLYGSHYSTAASVLFYMLRIEPFTSMHVLFQGGKFDHPDRQFTSIESCWNSATTSTSDVKELIPEFFYLPEFLENTVRVYLSRIAMIWARLNLGKLFPT